MAVKTAKARITNSLPDSRLVYYIFYNGLNIKEIISLTLSTAYMNAGYFHSFT